MHKALSEVVRILVIQGRRWRSVTVSQDFPLQFAKSPVRVILLCVGKPLHFERRAAIESSFRGTRRFAEADLYKGV